MKLNENLYFKIRDFVNERMGLYFTESRKNDLLRGLAHAAETFGYRDVNTCVEQLLLVDWSPEQIQTLASYLTVGETYFYRHKEQIDYIFDEYLKNKFISQKIRIWSAACCSGEEPYTIAILFKEKINNLKNWDITITATDINPVFLKKAKAGIFTEHSFRGFPVRLRNKYFKEIDRNHYKLDDSIKNMVKFKYLNLAAQTYPSSTNSTEGLDVIFCRNVFIYFNQEMINRVVEKFYKCLNKNGVLFVSPAETFMVSQMHMCKSHLSTPIFFTKDTATQNVKKTVDYTKILEKINKTPSLPKINKSTKKNNDNTFNSHKLKKIEKFDFEKQISVLDNMYEECKYDELLKSINSVNFSELSLKNKKTILALKGKSYANTGNLIESLKICETLIKLDKLDINSYFLHASILIEMNKIDIAVLELYKILYLDNSHIMTHFMLGNILRSKNKENDGNKHMRTALSLLKNEKTDKIIDKSEGLTVNRMIEIITTLLKTQGVKIDE